MSRSPDPAALPTLRSHRWRRDEFAELAMACKMRNVLLAEVVAQRVSDQIRLIVGTDSAAAGTSEHDTETGAVIRPRRRGSVGVGASSQRGEG